MRPRRQNLTSRYFCKSSGQGREIAGGGGQEAVGSRQPRFPHPWSCVPSVVRDRSALENPKSKIAAGQGRAGQGTGAKEETGRLSLSEQLQHRFAVADAKRKPVGTEAGVVGKAQRVEQGGAKILRRNGPAGDEGAVLVGTTVDCAAANARPGQERRVALRPVIAAGIRIAGDPGRAAEFADHDHQRRFEQAALPQVVEQRREGLVEPRQNEAQAEGPLVEDAALLDRGAVVVPALRGQYVVGRGPAAPGVHRHQPHAGFDEPPGQEQVLPQRVAAVAVTDGVGLLGQIDCPAGFLSRHQVQGLQLKLPVPRDDVARQVLQPDI